MKLKDKVYTPMTGREYEPQASVITLKYSYHSFQSPIFAAGIGQFIAIIGRSLYLIEVAYQHTHILISRLGIAKRRFSQVILDAVPSLSSQPHQP